MPNQPPRRHVNPYIAGSVVSGAEMFFGRDDVFAFIRRNLIGQHSNHPIVLYGQRRTGKTSALYQLRRHLGSEYWCVFIDLHALTLGGLGDLMQGIAIVISRELRRDHQVAVGVPKRSVFLADPAAAFEQFLDQVWAAIGDNQLVLMLDEVIRLDEEVRAGRLDRKDFEYLRHLMQHHDRLNFVFALSSGIEEMSKDYAFLFNGSLYHRISFLELSAARDLVTCPARGHYELTDQAVDRILQVTSGHPYYTQLVCHCVFDSWARNPAAIIDVGDVDNILGEAIELGSANLTYVWLDSSPAERAAMAGIAATIRGTGMTVTAGQVRDAWHDAGVDVPEHEITRALRGLTEREVITGSGAHSFTVDMQRLWLDKHRRLEWVKEELADAIALWQATAQQPASRPEHSPPEAEDPKDAQAPAPHQSGSLEPPPLDRSGRLSAEAYSAGPTVEADIALEKPQDKPSSNKETSPESNSGEGPYTKIVAVGTVVLVLLTYMLVAFTVHWWPLQGPDPDPGAGKAAQCKFLTGSVNTCSSRNPQIIVDATNEADSTNCAFNIELQWGDGSEVQRVPVSGGPVGAYFLANHTYRSPGTYVIQGTGTGSGGCSVVPATYNFTLLGS